MSVIELLRKGSKWIQDFLRENAALVEALVVVGKWILTAGTTIALFGLVAYSTFVAIG